MDVRVKCPDCGTYIETTLTPPDGIDLEWNGKAQSRHLDRTEFSCTKCPRRGKLRFVIYADRETGGKGGPHV